MQQHGTVTILLHSGDESLSEQCRSLSSRVQVVTPKALDAEPSLRDRIEVVYGGISPEQIVSMPGLRWMQATGAGVERFLTPEVRASQVSITNVSGIHAAPMTEHMFGMLLAYQRRLFQSWDRQKEAHWNSQGLGDTAPILEGKTLGLLGVGAIGSWSARVGKAFGMHCIGYRRSAEPHPDLERTFGPADLIPFLERSDVVMNTLPVTHETRGLLGAKQLASMKPGSVLVNTGRGATIRTDELVEALKQGRPGAALLDVTDPEPLPDGHPLWTMKNVVITPHYSGSHSGYSTRAEAIFLDNLDRYLRDEPLTHVVDKMAGY